MIAPFELKDNGWHEETKRHYQHRLAELVTLNSPLGESYRRIFLGLPPEVIEPPTLLRSLPMAKQCLHLGPMLDKTKCGTETFACKIHGTCSQQPHRCGDMKLCQNCGEWERKANIAQPAPSGTIIRNLLYHIYPVSGNGTWQWNVEQVCGRLKAFNGQIIVAIVTDPPTGRLPDPSGPNCPDGGRIIQGCDSAEMVKAEFAKRWPHDNIQFIELENDPKLREVKSLIPMLERVLSDDPNQITLYAQAKGTTRRAGHVARRWTEALYEIMFDYFPLAEEQLKTYPVTGCFKKLGAGWDASQSFSDYHYSGSWYWFRNADLYNRDWQRHDAFWSGIEPYPSQHFRPSESGCMFHEASVPAMNLYSSAYWKRKVNPEFNQWRVDNAKWRTDMWPK